MPDRAEAVLVLRKLVDDLSGLTAPPALETGGREPSGIIGKLLEEVQRVLELDFVYARLDHVGGKPRIEVVRVPEGESPPSARQMGRVLRPYLAADGQSRQAGLPFPLGAAGKVGLAWLPLDLDQDTGVVVAGSRRPGFPTQVELLLFRVAVGQASIAMLEAAGRAERRRSEEMTSRLTALNADLRREVTRLTRSGQELQGIQDELATNPSAVQQAFDEIRVLKDRLAQEKCYLEEEIRSEQGFEEIVGESKALRGVLAKVQIIASTDSTVLIGGESGTGKELIARLIHDLSPRRERMFVKLDCGVIPATLLESELFGHEEGAFTGAVSQRIGRFELAHQGTLFLDEVGELPLELQAKLHRILQERDLKRVGGTRTIHADVRLIAATSRDLKAMVAEGKFRSDLFYRLDVFPIVVPPLRERAEDIPDLVRHFTKRHAARMGKTITHIPAHAMQVLCEHDWPGNVREMQNVIERSVILSRGTTLEVPLQELHASEPAAPLAELAERERVPPPAPREGTLEDVERGPAITP